MIRIANRQLDRTMVALAIFALGGCAEDSSPLRVVPLAPAASRIAAGAEQVGTVGERTPEPLAVLVTDRFGNPVPEVEVTFAATAGGGSVQPPTARTGSDGIARAEWTLGRQAGPNTAAATVAELEPVVFWALAEPGPPATLERIAGDDQAATVGDALAQPLVVEVTDAYGNRIVGASVTWSVQTGGGDISPGTGTTDANGRAQAVWTLGGEAGEQRVTASAGPSAATVFTAQAAPGPPAGAAPLSGDGQSAPAGWEVQEPLVVKVADAYGNGIAGVAVDWEVTAGGGSVDPATSITDAAGAASTRLTVGPAPGPNSITARPAGLPAVVFSATALNPFDLSIGGVYLVQSTQTLAGDVPLVEGRDAYLRVFVVANYANAYQPAVRVELFDGATPITSETIPAPSASVPAAVDEASLGSSWNLRVPGAVVAPGLGIRITLDPDDDVPEGDDANNTFPSSGAVFPLDVRSPPPFEVHFVPVRIASATGNVNDGNAGSYLVNALKVFPLPGVNATVRSQPFTSSVTTTSTDTAWETIISEIYTLRLADTLQAYFYGVLPNVGGSPYCGLGFLGYPVAIGLDACGGWTAAHEWGHNFNRQHVGCGNPANPDPAYPYVNGSIGVYGLDVATGEIKGPTTHVDLMSYCTPEWISDYTFRAVLAFREAEAAGQPRLAFARAPEPALIVWGRMDRRSLVLEPAFELETRPALPAAPGPYTLQGLDAAGGVVFELSFAGEALGDGPPDARHFAFAVPASLAQPQRLARLRLTGPGLPPAERVRVAAQAPAPPAPALEAAGARGVRVRWNSAAHPLAVIRDPRTGAILSFARGGAALVRSDAAELELVISDGVGSTRQRVAVRR